jgi:hypothetical protein
LWETETDVLYGVAMDRAVMAYKGTETDVLYGVEMAWRADATAHALLTRGFTFLLRNDWMLSFQVNRLSSLGKLSASIFKEISFSKEILLLKGNLNTKGKKENLRKRKNLRKSKDFSEQLKYSSKCISGEESFTISWIFEWIINYV